MIEYNDLGLGNINACDEWHIEYDTAECERKTKRNDFWGGFLTTALTLVAGGKPSNTNTQENTQNDTKTPPQKSGKSALEIEQEMFERLTVEEKKAYAKQNPNSPVVQKWQSTRYWRNVAIGGGIVVGVSATGYLVMRAMRKEEPKNNKKKEKGEQD